MFKKPCKIIEGAKIYGNGHYRPILYWNELTDKEKKDTCHYEGVEESTFFRYRGKCYNLCDFPIVEKQHPFQGFADGHLSDSFFSGILVKMSDCGEGLKAYTYIS